MKYDAFFGGRHWYQGHLDPLPFNWYRFGIKVALIILLVVVVTNENWVLFGR